MCRSSTASPVSRVKADPDLSGLPSNVSFCLLALLPCYRVPLFDWYIPNSHISHLPRTHNPKFLPSYATRRQHRCSNGPRRHRGSHLQEEFQSPPPRRRRFLHKARRDPSVPMVNHQPKADHQPLAPARRNDPLLHGLNRSMCRTITSVRFLLFPFSYSFIADNWFEITEIDHANETGSSTDTDND